MRTADNLDERQALLQYVVAARKAIADLRPNQMRAHRLPSAMSEIGMIVEATESAADVIMTATDDLLKLGANTPYAEYRAATEAKCLLIMEACSFQDLTGQRMSKVVETLLTLEDRLGALAAVLGDNPEDEAPEETGDVLLNGPVMPGEGVDQDEIDKLFA